MVTTCCSSVHKSPIGNIARGADNRGVRCSESDEHMPHLGELRLAHAGGPAEEHGGEGASTVAQAGAATPQRPRDRAHRLLLPDHVRLRSSRSINVALRLSDIQRAALGLRHQDEVIALALQRCDFF